MKELIQNPKTTHVINTVVGGTWITTLIGVIPEITGFIATVTAVIISIILGIKQKTKLDLEIETLRKNKYRRIGDKKCH